MKYNYLKIAEIIKVKRLESGLSKRQLASLVGVSDTEINRIENGMKTNYNMVHLIKICNELDLDFVELLRIAGYLDNNKLKNYRVKAQCNKEEVYVVKAYTPKDAYRDVLDFIKRNKVFGNYNNELIQFYVSETDENISEELDMSDLFDENNEDDDEEYDGIFCIK